MRARVAIVQGTRPEVIKNYPIVQALSRAGVPALVLHTNQHWLPEMRDQIYANFGYQPDRILPGTYSIGPAIGWLQGLFKREQITHVVVNGDTAASLAGGIAALYSNIPFTHVEAGLRSLDPFMLEERNRIMVDSIASLLFAYTTYEQKVLEQSSDVRGEVLVEGNTTVDVIHEFQDQFSPPVYSEPYAFVTLHRKELTDSYQRMHTAVDALNRIAEQLCRVVFPVHPRTSEALRRYGLFRRLTGQVELLEPLDFLTALSLQRNASVVVTDSGCVQEEAYLLRVPCVTLRDNTERHLTVHHGANVVSGFDSGHILSLVQRALSGGPACWPEIYGALGVGDRIADRILTFDGRVSATMAPPLAAKHSVTTVDKRYADPTLGK